MSYAEVDELWLVNRTNDELKDEIIRLRTAIRAHRDEKGDDRCWLDDDRLYAVLPEQREGDSRLPELDVFIGSCCRFWENRQPPEPDLAQPAKIGPPAK